MLLCFEGEKMAKESGILETIGTILGLVTGGPKGAAIGAGVGSLLGGGNFQDALRAGVGSLFTTDPRFGMANAMFNFGGDSSPSSRGQNIISSASNVARTSPNITGMSDPLTMAMTGMTQGGIPGIFNTLISQETSNPMQALIAAGILNAATRRKNPFTEFEQRQYATGERNPDYRGTPAPDFRYGGAGLSRPTLFSAEGGMIDGPGTGKSDSVPAAIFQDGNRVQEARLSDGEFVMTADAVKGAGGGDRAKGAARMYKMMNQFEGRA